MDKQIILKSFPASMWQWQLVDHKIGIPHIDGGYQGALGVWKFHVPKRKYHQNLEQVSDFFNYCR